MSSQSNKAKILKELRLAADEPDTTSQLFQFKKFANQLADLVCDIQLPTPFSIVVHGEWGSGKTSLISRTRSIVEDLLKSDNTAKIIWFNAWEYEQLDPMLALMQQIELAYREGASKIRDAIKGMLMMSADIILRSKMGMTLDEVKEQFESSIKNIPTITEQLQKAIGEDGRLIVFIDDLDRCSVDNVLKILEAVKLFFSAKGAVFVFALDMTKLERAWDLKYGNKTSKQEGRDHVDKIFQLKLSLPPKEHSDVLTYVNNLAESLPQQIKELIVDGCPKNPRKIKRILNLIYFLAKGTEDDLMEKYLPMLAIWSISTIAYPELAALIKVSNNSLIQMAFVVNHLTDYHNLLARNTHLQEILTGGGGVRLNGIEVGLNIINSTTITGLNYISTNPDAFNFFAAIAKIYQLRANNDVQANVDSVLEKAYSSDTLGKLIPEIIYRAGLIG
jgi:KAP family P-loop domain